MLSQLPLTLQDDAEKYHEPIAEAFERDVEGALPTGEQNNQVGDEDGCLGMPDVPGSITHPDQQGLPVLGLHIYGGIKFPRVKALGSRARPHTGVVELAGQR